MWFRPLSMILYGFVIFASLANAVQRVAVAFVDVKFDDKAAVWSMLLDPRYDKVIAIMSGVNARDKAAYELDQYLDRQNLMRTTRSFDKNKLTIMEGGNALGKAVSHEIQWWASTPRKAVTKANVNSLWSLLRGSKVSIFQIAPTESSQIKAVIDAADAGSIESYMLLHGYNSEQATTARQMELLQNVQWWLKQNNPDVKVVFTSSFDTYADKNGGKQPYEEIKRMFPEQDLEQAMRDPFWSDQLLKGHTETQVRIPRFTYITDKNRLDDVIYQARTKPEENRLERERIANYIRQTLDMNPERSPDQNKRLGRFKYTLLQEFTGKTTLELADAAHIAAFHRYLDGGVRSGMRLTPVRFYPPATDKGKVRMDEVSGGIIHGYLLKGADRDQDLGYIKRLAGVR